MKAITDQFWWPDIRNDVADWINKCQTCQESKDPVGFHQHRAALGSYQICDGPNQRVHIDLCGPFKTPDGGKKYVMVICDAFTKYAVNVAITNKDRKTVAEAFYNNWIMLFSPPRMLVSDRGKEFDNGVINELCKTFNINKLMTSAIHPQANGQAERYNRTMQKYMRCMIEKDSLNWEGLLPSMTFAYNAHVHEATRMSPFFLTFFHDPNLPFDLDKPRDMADTFVGNRLKTLREFYQVGKENLRRAAEKNKRLYDEKSDPTRKYNVGDRVLVYYPREGFLGNKKFQRQWVSGYTVQSKVADDTYVLVPDDIKKRSTVVHADRIKLHVQGYTQSTQSTQQKKKKGSVEKERSNKMEQRWHVDAESSEDDWSGFEINPPSRQHAQPQEEEEVEQQEDQEMNEQSQHNEGILESYTEEPEQQILRPRRSVDTPREETGYGKRFRNASEDEDEEQRYMLMRARQRALAEQEERQRAPKRGSGCSPGPMDVTLPDYQRAMRRAFATMDKELFGQHQMVKRKGRRIDYRE